MTRFRVALLACLLCAATVPAGVIAAEESATIVHEGDTLTLHQSTGQTISGETTLPEGTTLSIRMRSTGDTSPAFLRVSETTVTEYGTFEAHFDMSEGPKTGTFEVTVSHDGDSLTETEGKIVPCDSNCTDVTVTEHDTPDEGMQPSPDRVDMVPVVEVTQTRTARIPVTFGDKEKVTITIGSEEVNYKYIATLQDRDDDGRAVVLFDTENAGTNRTTVTVLDDGGEYPVDAREEWQIPSLIDPGIYDMELYAGTNTSSNPATIGSLAILEAPPANPAPTETKVTETTTQQTTNTAASMRKSTGGVFGGDSAGLAAIIGGCVLGVVGIGALLGLFRSA
ncbi:BGTF surface domain-containing protein [Halogeometricum borinquense]|uniref:BGTF surface domain-containing protein n=1 Tax=Halogeometricum borinquense TaxID=60847 RepID=UPI0034317FCB